MNLIRADFYKIFRSVSFWIVFTLMTVCGGCFVYISYAVESGRLGMEVTSTAALLMDTMMVTIIGPVMAALFVCSDFQNKSIQSSILYGRGRKMIVWTKLVAYSTAMFLVTLPYAIATFIGYCSGAKFNLLFSKSVDSAYMSILANEAGAGRTASEICRLLLVLFIITMVHVSRCSLCVLMSYLVKSPVGVIAGGIVAELFLSILAVAGAGSEVVTSMIGWTPFISMQNHFLMNTEMLQLLKSFGTSLVFMLIIGNITVGIFSRAEVK